MSFLLANRFAAVVTSGVSTGGLRDFGEGSPSYDLWRHWSYATDADAFYVAINPYPVRDAGSVLPKAFCQG